MTDLLITTPKTADKQQIVQLIASLNNQPAHQCLHCDQEEAGILEEINLLEVPIEEAFSVAWDGDEIIGVLGVDLSAERDRAWLWGPFIKGNDWQKTADALHDHFNNQFQSTLKQLNQFLNLANVQARSYYLSRGFQETKTSHVYQTLPPGPSITDPYPEMTPPEWRSFIALHEQTFPTTYFSGRQIIERLGKQDKVFTCAQGENILGYVYANVEPSEGFIHFLAVQKENRGQGIGKKLLTTAVSWLFNKHNVPQVSLVVDDENDARHLYQKAGFNLLHSGVGLKKEYI